QHGGEIAASLRQVDALRTQFVAIEDHFRLRLVELQVRVGIDEDAAGESLLDEFVCEISEFSRFARRRDDEVYGEAAAAGKRRWEKPGWHRRRLPGPQPAPAHAARTYRAGR